MENENFDTVNMLSLAELPALTAEEIAKRKEGPCEFGREDDYGFQLLMLDRY